MHSAVGSSHVPRDKPTGLTSLRASFAAGGVAALVQASIVLPFLGRYGWDRDELYFLSAAQRPAWGYVDFPPMIAWIGWAVRSVFGDSLDALRLTSLAAMSVATLLVALMTRELGGGPRTQLAAALVWALSPYGLSAASIFHPTWFDALCWVALLYTLLVALQRDRPNLWLLAGAIAGIGLETKYTIAFLLCVLLVALLVADRHLLRTRWPWLGLATAIALLAPNLVWQADHDWPSLDFFSSQNAKTASDTPPLTYMAGQLLLAAGLIIAAIGVVELWRRRRLRPLALVPPLITLVFLLERGRAYYPLPADSIAVAAGTVALARWLATASTARRASLVGALVALDVAVLALALPAVLPLRSTRSMVESGVWKDSFYKDEIGWPELADETARAWHSITPAQRAGGAVVAGNYGEASALAYYGRARGLPPVLSGHLNWQYWRPSSLPQRWVLFVGYDPTDLAQLCRSWRKVATIDNRWHLDNEERGRIVALCMLDQPLGAIWDRSIATDHL